MNTAIVTGANGFIGSHIVHRLLVQGWSVFALGRATADQSWGERVDKALAEIPRAGDPPGRLLVRDVDLNAPPPELVAAVRSASIPTDAILIHVAGDTRFKPVDPEVQKKINVQSPRNLAGALQGQIQRMIHVSTAYVAGRRSGLAFETDLDRGQDFWNSYERSKFDGEVALAGACSALQLPLVIVRPSIIINDRQSGRASTFTHLNALVEVVSRLQDYYGLADGQVVSKQIRLLADRDARPNLAPVDSIVPPLLRIATTPAAEGKTFHLCHPRPHTNGEIMGLIRDAYDVSHLLDLEFVDRLAPPVSYTEEMAARALKAYAPYLNQLLEFDLTNARAIVPDYDSGFTPLDRDYVRRVIAFQRARRRK